MATRTSTITGTTTLEEVVDLMVEDIDQYGEYDPKYLNDQLELVKSPLIQTTNTGDRKINPKISQEIKNARNITYDRGRKVWVLD